jgi:hypothetical protein
MKFAHLKFILSVYQKNDLFFECESIVEEKRMSNMLTVVMNQCLQILLMNLNDSHLNLFVSNVKKKADE